MTTPRATSDGADEGTRTIVTSLLDGIAPQGRSTRNS